MQDKKPQKNPFIKVVLAAVLTASAGLGMLYIYMVGTWPSAEVLRFAWLAALGVVAGLLSRWILGRHTGMLRFLAAWFSVVVGLWTTDWITHGYLGFEVLYFDHPYPDYAGLFELSLPWLTAVLGLRAWKRPRQKPLATPPEPAPSPVPLPASLDVRPVPVREYKASKLKVWFDGVLRRGNAWLDKLENRLHQFVSREVTVPLNGQAASEPMVGGVRPYRPVAVRRYTPTTPTDRQKQQAESKVEEEHRCPYCLEIVDLNDYRGVKVCHICGAYHHADCWNVTGSCMASHSKK